MSIRFEALDLLEARAAARYIRFRAPHFTANARALLEEFDLATGGVLYLDELESFSSASMHVLVERINERAKLEERTGVAGLYPRAIVASPCPVGADDETDARAERWQDNARKIRLAVVNMPIVSKLG